MEDAVLNLEAEQTQVEDTVNRGPGLKEPVVDQAPEVKPDTPAQPNPPVQQINPALKFGRRMDYKTAKVNDKQIKDLNLSMPSPPPPPANNHQKEPKSALELELEALEAKEAKETKEASASSMIPNPLPTPKKRVPRELEFDIEPPEYAMHFDLVDMNGKDFFDIN